MNFRRAIVSVFCVLLIAVATACDREWHGEAPLLDAAGQRLLHLRTITQLLPNRPTHLAVDRLGHIFWVQESEDAQDVLFMIDSLIPRATRLTTGNIVEAIEAESESTTDTSGAVTGNIRALAPAERGVFFYFYGFRGKSPRACLGLYLPQSGRIRILADTDTMEKVSEMGRSLQLAQPTLVVSGDTAYLWLRHMDASVFVAFDVRIVQPFGPIEVRRPFKQVVADHRALPLHRIDAEISPGADGTILMIDRSAGLLYRIDPSGDATALFSLIGLPRQLAPPTVAPDGTLRTVAAESPPMGTELEVLTRRDLPRIDYPALLELSPQELRFIPRDNFRAPTGFPVYTVRLGRLFPEAADSYISYDAASGALMRVRIEERR